MPHIETHWDPKSVRNNCMLNMHPHPDVLSRIYIDLVLAWGWRKFVILYENEQSLVRISPLLSIFADHGIVVMLRPLESDVSPGNYRSMLTNVKKSGEQNFVLDCSIDILEEVLRQAQQVGLVTERFSFIVTNLDFQTVDLDSFQFSGSNITGVRITILCAVMVSLYHQLFCRYA